MATKVFLTLQLLFLLPIHLKKIFWNVRKCPEIGKNQKEIKWPLMAAPRIFGVWRASGRMEFLSKELSKYLKMQALSPLNFQAIEYLKRKALSPLNFQWKYIDFLRDFDFFWAQMGSWPKIDRSEVRFAPLFRKALDVG